jgi:hypothetical protein
MTDDLADLRSRLFRARGQCHAMASFAGPADRDRLLGKVEGIELALDYIRFYSDPRDATPPTNKETS